MGNWREPVTVFDRVPTLAILGASISQRNNMASGTNPNILPTGFMSWFDALNYKPFDTVSYGGVGGQTLVEAETALQANVLARLPNIVLLGNDCAANSIAGGVQAAVALITLDSIITKILATNARIVVSTIPPNVQLSSANDASSAKNTQAHIFNDGVLSRCRNDSRLKLWHWGEHQVDLSEATGRYVTTSATGAAATTWTHDGTHPHPKYAIKLAQLLTTAMGGMIGTRSLPMPSSNNYPYRCIANPMNFGVGGSLVGGATGAFVGNNCTLTGSAATAISEVARTDMDAKWKRILSTAETGNVTYAFAGAGAIPANMVAGTTPIFAFCEIVLNVAPTNLRGFEIRLTFSGSTVVFTGFNTSATGGFASLADAGPYIPLTTKLLLCTAIGVLPAAATNFTITVESTKSATGNMTVDWHVGRAGIAVAPYVPTNASIVVTP